MGLTIPAWSAPALTVTSGYEPYAEALAGVRLRSFNNTGGSELFLGTPDLGAGANREERSIRWAATNEISFSYDRPTDNLNVTITNTNGAYPLNYPHLSIQLTALGKTYTVDDLNVMQITLADRDNDGTVLLQNVIVDG